MAKRTLRVKRAGAKDGSTEVLLRSRVSTAKTATGNNKFAKKTGGKHARKGAKSARKSKRARRKLRGGRGWSSCSGRQKGGTPSPEKASLRKASPLGNKQTKRPKPSLSFALPAQTAADEDAAAAEVQAGAADELSSANIDKLFAKAAQLSSEDQHALEKVLMGAN